MQEQATEAAAAAVAHNVTKAGAGTVILGWLTLNDFALLIGVIVTLAGFGVNLYYKRKADRRESELHAARLAEIREHGRAD